MGTTAWTCQQKHIQRLNARQKPRKNTSRPPPKGKTPMPAFNNGWALRDYQVQPWSQGC